MSLDRHPDWFRIVRRHWRKTVGFLLASTQPCLAIRDQELKAVRGRVLASRSATDLLQWGPPESWVLSVLLCPGDSLQPVVEWTARRKVDASRVWFFLHPSTDPEVLRPWVEAGHETDQVQVVSSWHELHKFLGLALNDRVYADWKHVGSE